MKLGPWHADDCSTGREITSFFSANQKLHSYVHKSMQLGPIFSQLIPLHILISCFFKIHFNIEQFYLLRYDAV
jgi:hypothetical protein